MIFLHILLGKGAFFIALHQYRGYVALHEGLRRHLSPLECRRRILILSVSSLNDFGTAQCGPVFFAIATGAFSGRARAGGGPRGGRGHFPVKSNDVPKVSETIPLQK